MLWKRSPVTPPTPGQHRQDHSRVGVGSGWGLSTHPHGEALLKPAAHFQPLQIKLWGSQRESGRDPGMTYLLWKRVHQLSKLSLRDDYFRDPGQTRVRLCSGRSPSQNPSKHAERGPSTPICPSEEASHPTVLLPGNSHLTVTGEGRVGSDLAGKHGLFLTIGPHSYRTQSKTPVLNLMGTDFPQ